MLYRISIKPEICTLQSNIKTTEKPVISTLNQIMTQNIKNILLLGSSELKKSVEKYQTLVWNSKKTITKKLTICFYIKVYLKQDQKAHSRCKLASVI